MTLSNSDLLILQIINDKKSTCGYEINKIITERGYRNFDEVAASSIYASLKKMEKEKIVQTEFVGEKKGRGPLPKNYKLSHEGKNLLREEVRETLMTILSNNSRFSVALSALNVLSRSQIQKSFEKRIVMIEEMQLNFKDILKKKKKEKLTKGEQVFDEFMFEIVKGDLKFAKKVLQVI